MITRGEQFFNFETQAQEIKIAIGAKTNSLSEMLKAEVTNMLSNGLGEQEIVGRLQRDLVEGGRVFGTIMRGTRNVASSSMGQIAQGEIFGNFEDRDEWEWIVTSKKPCEDCAPRHGEKDTWENWRDVGLPRSGFSVCEYYCKCELLPTDMVSDELEDPVVVPTLGELRDAYKLGKNWTPEGGNSVILTAPKPSMITKICAVGGEPFQVSKFNPYITVCPKHKGQKPKKEEPELTPGKNQIIKTCAVGGEKFITSKFTPYITVCKKHKGQQKKEEPPKKEGPVPPPGYKITGKHQVAHPGNTHIEIDGKNVLKWTNYKGVWWEIDTRQKEKKEEKEKGLIPSPPPAPSGYQYSGIVMEKKMGFGEGEKWVEKQGYWFMFKKIEKKTPEVAPSPPPTPAGYKNWGVSQKEHPGIIDDGKQLWIQKDGWWFLFYKKATGVVPGKNQIVKKCSSCGAEFAGSKFTPYTTVCKKCKGEENDKKIEKVEEKKKVRTEQEQEKTVGGKMTQDEMREYILPLGSGNIKHANSTAKTLSESLTPKIHQHIKTYDLKHNPKVKIGTKSGISGYNPLENTILLEKKYFEKDGTFAKEGKEVILHEFGHFLDRKIMRKQGDSYEKFRLKMKDEAWKIINMQKSDRSAFNKLFREVGTSHGAVADLFGAVTLNKVGYGHSNSYYRPLISSSGEVLAGGEGKQLTEAFANMTAIYCDPLLKKKNWGFIKKHLPGLASEYEKWAGGGEAKRQIRTFKKKMEPYLDVAEANEIVPKSTAELITKKLTSGLDIGQEDAYWRIDKNLRGSPLAQEAAKAVWEWSAGDKYQTAGNYSKVRALERTLVIKKKPIEKITLQDIDGVLKRDGTPKDVREEIIDSFKIRKEINPETYDTKIIPMDTQDQIELTYNRLRQIRSFVHNAPHYKGRVNRIMNFAGDEGTYNSFRDSMKRGDNFETRALSSWSKGDAVYGSTGGLRVQIVCTNSTGGVDIKGLSGYSKLEDEILMPSKKYQIVKTREGIDYVEDQPHTEDWEMGKTLVVEVKEVED